MQEPKLRNERVYGIALIICPILLATAYGMRQDELFLFTLIAWVYAMIYSTGRWV